MTTRDVETVLASYVECALWSSVDFRGDDGGNGEPFDAWATMEDLAPDTLEGMHADVTAFVAEAATVAGQEWWTDEQLGHDFWLTRNGHGAGFWDRGQGEAGERLTAAAKVYGGCDLCTGDDGKVYAS